MMRRVRPSGAFYRRACCAVIASLTFVQTLRAQVDSGPSHTIVAVSPASNTAVADFLARARDGTAQFRDRRAAIAVGYRRFGMDFPSMGEHWVNPGLVMAGRFDAARPAMLSYVVIDGQPVLAGVVYAIPLAAGENPPPVPGGEGMWHEHNGTVDEESLLPEHNNAEDQPLDHDRSPTGGTGTRLAVLHVWIGVPNPAGVFTAENWALPFARLGIAVPASVPVGAARALSLASGANEYYSALATNAGGSPVSVANALDDARHAVEMIAAHARVAHALSATDIAALAAVWTQALNNIARDCGPSVAIRLNGGSKL